jgi:hypothetical protein
VGLFGVCYFVHGGLRLRDFSSLLDSCSG